MTSAIDVLSASDIFAALSDGVIACNTAGVMVAVNESAARVLGYEIDDLVGEPVEKIIPVRFQQRHAVPFSRWAATGQLTLTGQQLSLPARGSNGEEVELRVTLHHIDFEDEPLAVALVRSAVDAATPRSELALALLGIVDLDATLSDLLERLMEVLTSRLEWDAGLVWLPNEVTGRLGVAAAWPLGTQASYVEESMAISFSPGEAIVGEVFNSGVQQWVDDLLVHSGFERADAARRDGLQAGLFFPVVAANRVVGVVELVTRQRRGIDLATHEAVHLLRTELGGVVKRRADHERAMSERQQLRLALESAHMGVWTWDLSSDVVRWSEQLQAIHGRADAPFDGARPAFLDTIDPDDRAVFEAQLANAARSGDRFDYLYRAITDDGAVLWLKGSGQGLRNADGVIRAVTGVVFDVTEAVDFAAELEERVAQASLAAAVGKALTGDRDLRAKLGQCAEIVVEHLDAAFARVWSLADGDDALRLEASAGIYTHLDGEHAVIPVGKFKIGTIAAERTPVLTNDVVNDPRVSDPEWARRENMQSFAGYPLIVGNRCVGVLGLFATHELTDNALRMLGTVADMVALGIEQGRSQEALVDLYNEAKRESAARKLAFEDRDRVAAVLQQSLLPPDLPEISYVDLGSRYIAATEQVGGDFFDVFPLRGRTWGLAIGDICGKGPQAAASTALARHSLRTAAMLERGPARAIKALNQAMRSPGGGLCTASFGRLRATATRVTLSMARAGHPPPVVRRADGSVFSPIAGGPMMGVFADVDPTEQVIRLEAGDVVVFYTDGVLEARSGDEFFGEERLTALVATSTATSAQALADEVAEAAVAFQGDELSDDIAVLVLRVKAEK